MPAKIENTAPIKNATAVCTLINIAIVRPTTTIKTAKYLYSLFKKAIAPSSICPAISCISLSPGSFLTIPFIMKIFPSRAAIPQSADIINKFTLSSP